MLPAQIKFNISSYSKLYDLIVPEDHILRKIHDFVDFSFIYEELSSKYCLDNGREAKSPILLFKYLLLKYLYNLSDEGVVERSKYDLSFKFFLDMIPEEDVIHPSLLTKFRKQRLKDEKLLDLLINKSVEIAIAEGVIKSRAIIVDSTHTNARFHKMTRREMLIKESAALKESLTGTYGYEGVPEEPDKHATLEKYREYSTKLIVAASESPYAELPNVKEEISLLNEMLEDKIDTYDQSIDQDARIGHKSEGKSFYGYKTHIAMTEDRIITAATITSGETFDGAELADLVQKSRDAGINVEEVLADTAYSTLDNLIDAKSNGYKLISKLNPSVANGMRSEDEFIFNKDAGTMQCPVGYLAVTQKYEKRAKVGKNDRINYSFDIEKCKCCPHREGCYKENAKSKTYSITIKSDYHLEQKKFQETEYFKTRMKERYMIEAKNSELKGVHGYDQCGSAGLDSMQIQGAVTIFVANLKRIMRLNGQVCPNLKKGQKCEAK